MAITITRGLTSLVSVFNQQSIEFTVPNGTAGVAVTVGGYVFTPVRTSTVTVDTYVMDLTDILRYVLGFPNDDILSDITTYGTTSCTVSISATGQTTVTTTGNLCFGYDAVGDTVISALPTIGGGFTRYHNGSFVFYFGGSAGTYTVVIGGIPYNYALVTGYNTLTLHSSQLVSGALTITTTDVAFNVVYLGASSGSALEWIDSDGGVSTLYPRKLGEGSNVASSNSVPTYYQAHADLKQKSVNISKTKTREVILDCIAKDDTHFRQLTKIQESVFVAYDSIRYSVKSSDNYSAECRQNLHFTITLEQEQYVPTY